MYVCILLLFYIIIYHTFCENAIKAGEGEGKGRRATSNAHTVVNNSREKIRKNCKKKDIGFGGTAADGRTSARWILPRTAADNCRPRPRRRTAVWALGFSSNPSLAPGRTWRRRRVRGGRWCSNDDNILSYIIPIY